MPVHTALFPMPLPLDDAWCGIPCGLGSQRRNRVALRKLVRLVVIALNYLHARAPFSVVQTMWRRPSSLHQRTFRRIAALCRAGGPPEMISIFGCGRKSFQLDARFRELQDAVQSLGIGGSMYHSGGAGKTVRIVNDKDQLMPYRELDASRLKIVGTGEWDCRPYLDDLFYMPFVDPIINTFDIKCPRSIAPDFSRSSAEGTMALCKLWDARSLLRLFHVDEAPTEVTKYVKVFNNFKGPLVDRQIGDKRGVNFSEGKLAGVSRSLPTGCSLLQIMPEPFVEQLRGSITDRRDFYHQFMITREKCITNLVHPPLPLEAFVGLKAHDAFLREVAVSKGAPREVAGDFLHKKPRSLLVSPDTCVVAGFSALFQGDHLGVEIATLAHMNFLMSKGLLHKHHLLQSTNPLINDDYAEGLVIDDYFVISKEPLGAPSPSLSEKKLLSAKAAYQDEKILGSDDKDVWGSDLFCVCGTEIDSRPEMVRRGVVSAAAPAEKRFALALLAARCASLPYTSDALHSCLIGSLVSVSLMRRPLLACMNEVFKVIPSVELAPGNPILWPLSRRAGDELVVMSCLLPIAVSNLAATMSREVFATDASLAKGAIVSTEVKREAAEALWRSSDKKVKSVPMMRSSEAVLAWADPMVEPLGEFREEPVHESFLPSTNPSWLDFLGEEENNDNADVEQVPRPIGLWFQFLEICGGAGVVTREIIKLGIVAGPVFDLSVSPQFDMVDHKVLRWIIFMMEQGRLMSWLCSPPCTSFSPAAHPAVRSYACPEGFDQTNRKVIIGNTLAYGMLTLMMTARRTGVFGMGETPLRSKMRWLKVWRRIVALGASEVLLDSCAYGSIHQKGFCFLTINMNAGGLSKRCTRDHEHVRIEGKYTKNSAIYCDGLASALARCFRNHITSRINLEKVFDFKKEGLEDIVTNDVCQTHEWRLTRQWRWRGRSHINILETSAAMKLNALMARRGGDVRFTNFVDSHVAKSVLTRCRSSSDSLRALLHQNSALALAFGLYPSYRFAPTRLNPADHPTRDAPFPEVAPSSILREVDKLGFYGLLKISSLRRVAANWVRLTLLASPAILDFLADPSSFRRHGLSTIMPSSWQMDFDASLGYPGEGPFRLVLLAFLGLLFCAGGAPTRGFLSHGDCNRKAARAGFELPEGRRVLETTSEIRGKLMSSFLGWLDEQGFSFNLVFMASPPDLDGANDVLVKYGRWLFKEGKPYYHFSELVNAITAKRPLLRRSLQAAWDLAFMWGSFEPVEHHVAMPHQILVAMIASAWCWGWTKEAAIFALAFGGLLRIGEVLQSRRADLLLPEDVNGTISHILLRIKEPKTRFRAARHQSARIEQPDLIEIIRIGLGQLRSDEWLWHMSGSTLRSRFNKLLEKLALPCKAHDAPKPLSLASFRPGGATWLLAECENIDLIKRRGRWASEKVMNCYLQEVTASTYMMEVSSVARERILSAYDIFPSLMAMIIKFHASKIPQSTWWFLLRNSQGQTKGQGG